MKVVNCKAGIVLQLGCDEGIWVWNQMPIRSCVFDTWCNTRYPNLPRMQHGNRLTASRAHFMKSENIRARHVQADDMLILLAALLESLVLSETYSQMTWFYNLCT